MTYKEAIDFLFSQLPIYSRVGAPAYKKDLGNIISLCNSLGDPQHKFKAIHVAGTNGKGSTSHMLSAVLQSAGYKTGLYTSPHIHDFRERIRINGEMVPEEFVVDFVMAAHNVIRNIQPSFFEVTVAMAFDYFARNKVNIAVIETGLGGRLDSTNIIQPLLSVITNIGMDHTEILGDTIEKIASEKAGIIKRNVPVVIGEVTPPLKELFTNIANENNSEIHFSSEEYSVEYIESTDNLLICHIKHPESGTVEKLSPELKGLYQVINARTVLCCIDQLRKVFEIPEEALQKGISNVKKLTGIFGRWEVLPGKPTVVLDVAHNKEGLQQIMFQLNNNHPGKKCHFIIGVVKEKNIDGLFSIFPEDSVFYFTEAHIPRALPHFELKNVAAEQGINGGSYEDVNDALSAAKKNASPDDIIIVCGSFFLVSEVILPSADVI